MNTLLHLCNPRMHGFCVTKSLYEQLPQQFKQCGFHVRQLLPVSQTWKAFISNSSRNFFPQAYLNMWMVHKKQKKTCQGCCCGVCACKNARTCNWAEWYNYNYIIIHNLALDKISPRKTNEHWACKLLICWPVKYAHAGLLYLKHFLYISNSWFYFTKKKTWFPKLYLNVT